MMIKILITCLVAGTMTIPLMITAAGALSDRVAHLARRMHGARSSIRTDRGWPLSQANGGQGC